jgi:hypothetical protein
VADAHTLVVYGSSQRADASLREVARAARAAAASLTVVALALQEPARRRCCDMQSAFWNGLMREMARSELGRARLAVDDDSSVALDVLGFSGLRAPDVIADYAVQVGAERIVLADPRAAGLGRLALRRLRRRSAVPVSDGPALPTPYEPLSAR